MPRTPGNNDFIHLRDQLRIWIASSDIEFLRDLVRMSFHDLINTNIHQEGGPHGCIAKTPVIDFRENRGLSEAVILLQNFVSSRFSDLGFTMGDAISLAGKVAIEIAYAHADMRIPWRYGRRACLDPYNETESGTNGTIDTLAVMNPFLERYHLSAFEMAVLTAGTHGLNGSGALADNTGFGTLDFAYENSGKAWINKTLSNAWAECPSDAGLPQYCSFDTIYQQTIMRLPSDMLFFPTLIKKGGSPAAYEVEGAITAFAKQPEEVFHRVFEAAFAKMLEIGTSTDTLTPFHEDPDAQLPPPLLSILDIVLIAVSSVMLLLLLMVCCSITWTPSSGYIVHHHHHHDDHDEYDDDHDDEHENHDRDPMLMTQKHA